MSSNPINGTEIANFINSLDRQQKGSFLTGGLCLPLIKQLPLSLPDSYSLLFLKFTAY